MTSRIERAVLPALRTGAAAACMLMLACSDSPPPVLPGDAGADGPDAGLLGAPCEKSAGACAGAVRARLADGGFEPVCTGASYGAAYEPVETRCDGLDNDCDGETDRRWAVLHERSLLATWEVAAARLDAGFLVFAHESDGGYALRRFDDRLEPAGSAEQVPVADGGGLNSANLFQTQQGAGLTYLQTTTSSSGYFSPLSASGALLRGADGAPLTSPLNASPQGSLRMLSAPSEDGTRVLTVLATSKEGWFPSTEVFGVLTDAQGAVQAGPTSLMRVQDDGLTRSLYLRSLVADGEGHLLAAVEAVDETREWTLRLQRFSRTLEPVGEPRLIEVSDETDAHLASVPGAPGQPARLALAYRERVTDGGVSHIRVVRDLSAAAAPETWAEVSPGTPWLRFQGTARGLQLAWKSQVRCPECPSADGHGTYQGRVYARSETSGVVELTPGAEDLSFDVYSRPGVGLTPGRDGWMAFFLPVMGDGGVELRAVTYCMP